MSFWRWNRLPNRLQLNDSINNARLHLKNLDKYLTLSIVTSHYEKLNVQLMSYYDECRRLQCKYNQCYPMKCLGLLRKNMNKQFIVWFVITQNFLISHLVYTPGGVEMLPLADIYFPKFESGWRKRNENKLKASNWKVKRQEETK